MPIQSTFGAGSKRGYSGSGKSSVPFYFSAAASNTGRFPGTPTLVDTFSNSSPVNNTPASGYVRITLPATQTYRFTLKGAAQYGNSGYAAQIVATATLPLGTQLIIACGQIGVTADSNNTGGSGGTFIGVGSSLAGATPFLVAAGGGGNGGSAGGASFNPAYANASLNQNGKVGFQAGFNNNYGAGAGFPQAPWGFGNGATSKASGGEIYGWDGGGWNNAGSNTSNRSGGSGGGSWLTGLNGGVGETASGVGGFGGGGGMGNNCGYGGGGGGYTGGGSGGAVEGCGGSGGGGGNYYSHPSILTYTVSHVDGNYGSCIIDTAP